MRFFDYFVKGVPRNRADFEADAEATVQEGNGRWRAEAEWPPSDAVNVALPIKPGVYTDTDGSYGGGYHVLYYTEAPGMRGLNPHLGLLPQIGTWTFTKALPHSAHLAGMARATLKLTTSVPNVTAIVQLYDVDRKAGSAQHIVSGAYLVPGPAGNHEVSFDLYPQDWRIAPGHSIGILVTASDPSRWEPGRTGTVVIVRGGKVRVPFLRYLRDAFIHGERGNVVKYRETFSTTMIDIDGSTVKGPLPPRQLQGDCWRASPDDDAAGCRVSRGS
jgi:predicted acyl esterase